MNYIEDVLFGIIKESANQDSIIDAIKKRYSVMLTYEPDEHGKGGGTRMIQPVAYGTSKAGNPVVRAFQPYGDTTTKIPHWKMFRLDKIGEWKPLKNQKFTAPDGYNKNGDDGMSEVYVTSNFDNSRYEKSGLKKYNDERHKQAVDKDAFYDLKKNIKNSVNGMQFDYIKKNVEQWQNSEAASQFKGNAPSVYDMSRANNFGDDVDTQTVGPVTKGDFERNTDNGQNETPNYGNALMNGPVYKNDKQANADVNDEEEETDNINNEYNERI